MAEETSESLQKLRRLLEEARREDAVEVLDVGERIHELRRCHGQFHRPVKFNPGDIVKWKRPLKNKRRPRYDEPAIVMEVLSEPRIDPTTETGSTYFGEPLDIILGIIDPDGDFAVFHYDHRRFESWGPTARAKGGKTSPTRKR
jgi:hypothetical protein